jgi:hypothetical protein
LGYAQTAITSAELRNKHEVSVQVSNTSSRDGVEIVQVYAHRIDRTGLPSDEPVQKLVGYARVPVPAGGTVTATVVVDRDAYRTWNPDHATWEQWTGPIELRVGSHSRKTSEVLLIQSI